MGQDDQALLAGLRALAAVVADGPDLRLSMGVAMLDVWPVE